MSDADTRADPPVDRQEWLLRVRRENEESEATLADVYDANWGEIDDAHRGFVERFLSKLPPGGRVLDAACGTGKYVGMVLDSGRTCLATDHTQAYLAKVRTKFPEVPTAHHDLQELPYRAEFDGVMCVDAMEFVPPEEWPMVLDRFHAALRDRGWLYLTVETVLEDQVHAANDEARGAGLPVVDGEVIWHDPDDYYHYYPPLDRVRSWLADAGFTIADERPEPWHDEGYAYHHVLSRLPRTLERI